MAKADLMRKSDLKFVSPTSGVMEISSIVAEISEFINSEPESFYTVVIGSDSQAKKINGKAEIDFVTAIVVHRQGRGGRYFYRKEKRFLKPILREKIYTETLMSLSTAQEIVPLLREAITPTKYDLEIHIDVGPLGPTREMIQEVVGMVNGNGFIAKTKPDSWGASHVADKYT